MDNQYELYHYGILGMRWGIRHYQNADGSLTSAGKKHYGSNKEIGDKKHIERAKDAARIDDKIKKMKSKLLPNKNKIKKLSAMRDGLLSDLDSREIEYGKLQLSFDKYLDRHDLIAPTLFGGALGGGLIGVKWAMSEEGTRAQELQKELNKLNAEAKAEAKRLKKERRDKEREYWNSKHYGEF